MESLLHNWASPAVAGPSQAHITCAQLPKNPAGCLWQTKDTSNSGQAPLHRLPHLMLRTARAGAPFADGKTEAQSS